MPSPANTTDVYTASNLPNVRRVLTGAEGRLYATINNASVFLAHINEFTLTANFGNADYHPVGGRMVYSVPVTEMYTITVSETVVAGVNGDLLKPWADRQLSYRPMYLDFTGVVYDPEPGISGTIGSDPKPLFGFSFTNCIPDGSVDLMAIRPGTIITRPWTFRCNSKPSILTSESALNTFKWS